jgi:molybdopterin synthase catalytic subunit
MIEITERPISPQKVIDKVKTDSSGCVVTYIGLIRNYSQGSAVLSVEYRDSKGNVENKLQKIAREAEQRWQIDGIAITHRVGKLKVGEINLVVAVASPHRSEGFAACQYVIDQFKERLSTKKTETYQDGEVCIVVA